MEDLRSVLEREGQVGEIGRGDRDVACRTVAGAGGFEDGARGAGSRTAVRGLVGEESGRGEETCADAERALEKAASIAHGDSLAVKEMAQPRARMRAALQAGKALDAKRGRASATDLTGRRAVQESQIAADCRRKRLCAVDCESSRAMRRGR